MTAARPGGAAAGGAALLLDTQAWAWSLTAPERLTAPARRALERQPMTFLSAVTFYEIAFKARLGKWPEMAPRVPQLEALAARQGVEVLDATAGVSLRAATLDWPHRDPFDRLIAATALVHGLGLVSSDAAFDALPGLARLW